MKTLSIVIPAHNEARTLAEIIRRVQSVDLGPVEKEIIVVDNNSTDDTASIARSIPGIRVLEETIPGKGAAVRCGFREASGDILIIQDADLEYDPNDFPAMIKPILDGTTEVTNGVRIEKNRRNGLPFLLFLFGWFGNNTITLLTNILFHTHAGEYEGCYKAFSKKLVDTIPVRANGFPFENELICKILKRGHTIIDVPIHYSPRTYADGKKINWKDGFRILFTVIRCRFSDEI